MNIESFRDYCISKKGVTEEFPFGEETLVFKVLGKMFALINIDSFTSINLKYYPDTIEELREQHECVKPGYHMNKKHWNTVMVDGSVPDKQLRQWIDDSYNLVIDGLPKKLKEELKFL
jgi:predicted DNA-binding protein (MmcQ/YjbR family)